MVIPIAVNDYVGYKRGITCIGPIPIVEHYTGVSDCVRQQNHTRQQWEVMRSTRELAVQQRGSGEDGD